MSTGYKQLDRLQDRGFPTIVRANEQIYSTKIMQLKVRKASEFIDDQMPEHRADPFGELVLCGRVYCLLHGCEDRIESL